MSTSSMITKWPHQYGRYMVAGSVFILLLPCFSPAQTEAPPSNDDFNAAKIISALPYTDTNNTSEATSAADDPTLCSGGKGKNTVWYSYTPSVSGVLIAKTAGSNYDTVLAVWTGLRGSLSQNACNDDWGGATTSLLAVSLTAGTTYYIEVAGYSTGGQLSLALLLQAGTQTPSLGEAVDNTALTWFTGGDLSWFSETSVFYSGGDAAQSGNVGSGQVSWIQTTVAGPGILSFYWEVSSSTAYSRLAFSIDGVLKSTCQSTTWVKQSYPIPTGSHTLIWLYAPNSSGHTGFLDQVEITPGPAILLQAPNGGESLKTRDLKSITWINTDDIARIKLELYKGGSLRYTIIASGENLGSQTSWWVPLGLEIGADYRIKISSVTNPGIYDFSDGYFSIAQCQQCDGGLLDLYSSTSSASAVDHPELNLGGDSGTSFTIEARYYEVGNIIRRGHIASKSGSYDFFVERSLEYIPGYGYVVMACLGATNSSGNSTYRLCGFSAAAGWHHVAAVYSNTGQVQFYMNGSAMGSPFSIGATVNSTQPLIIGSGLNGAVDEVRISNVARYTGSNYTVPTPPFSCDAQTRALWNFNERKGSTVFHDACGVDNVLMGGGLAKTDGILRRNQPQADFDNDGRQDLTLFDPSLGAWYRLPSGSPGSNNTTWWGLPTDIPVPGDYDGDGKTDHAVWRPGAGAWYVLRSGVPGTYEVAYWGLPTDIPVSGDYDGDGKTDYAVYRPGTGAWYVLPSGAPGTYDAAYWGLPTDIPAPGDYDGDGKTDYAVYRPGTGAWYVLLSGAPGTYAAMYWGLSGDIPVPGDYDGDGKTDYAVYRPDNGAWYILPSSAPGTYSVMYWGLPDDIPVPGDYDGDGKTDCAVWRPSNATWYILRSGAPGTYTSTPWGISTDLPISPLTAILRLFRK